MNIDDLLNKYFEGETSVEEERHLRAFFASDKVPQRLAIYKPMFAYFDEEIKKKQQKQKVFPAKRSRLFYWVSGIVAGLLLLVGLRQMLFTPDPCYCSDNYVVINGRCYTDLNTVRSLALEALHEVATPAEEYFPEEDMETIDREIIENQLKELGDIFSDEE